MLALVAPHGLGQTTVRGYDSNGAKSNAKACWTKIKAVRLRVLEKGGAKNAPPFP